MTPTSGTGISTKYTRQFQSAFSLLELMIVVAIIGLMAGTLVLSANLGSGERQLEREAFRLNGLVQILREEALMQNRDYGIELSERGYRFYVFDYLQLQWLPPLNDRLLVEYELPESMAFELILEDRDITLDPTFEETIENAPDPEPQILILSTGVLTPFELSVFRDRTGGRLILNAALDGSLDVSRNGFN